MIVDFVECFASIYQACICIKAILVVIVHNFLQNTDQLDGKVVPPMGELQGRSIQLTSVFIYDCIIQDLVPRRT